MSTRTCFRITAAATSCVALLALASLLAPPGARAEEGMWTFDNLPLKPLEEKYGFTPSPEWIEHVQRAAVRFNDGGSGAFVSDNGLVLTNHHVALGQLQKVSSARKDYVKDGFYAHAAAEEMKCPDLELNVLMSTEDVTARVLVAIQPGLPPKQQNEQRRAEMARIEKESTDSTGLRSNVIELYQGGEYWLYRYKKYTDVRLVMAPEQQAAFYGGDPDNFTYPRFDLDMAFFRVYENGKPVHPRHWFRWSRAGAKEGELVFVIGNPGRTSRQETMKQLEHDRDDVLPTLLQQFELRRKAFYDYAARGPEQARQVKDRIFGFENELKRSTGMLEGLRDPALMGARAAAERTLRAQVSRDPKLAREIGPAWDRIAAAQAQLERRHKELSYRSLLGTRLAPLAGMIVRYVAEVQKPNGQRYEEFRDSNLESLRFRLFSPAPIYPELEEHMLAVNLQESLDELGPRDPYVKLALGGRSPRGTAHELIAGTKLADPAERRRLVEGGVPAVQASTDPLIEWARGIDPVYRELRDWGRDNIESVEKLEGNKIARARFAAYGKSIYPDATFTLRLSYGTVAGYPQGTSRVPYKTTFGGLFDRAASFDNKPPFDLSPLEAQRRAEVSLGTPLDFVSTNDIIGGNSGSPVLNRDGELVGVVFDGNIQSLVWDYAYTDAQARAVSVHSSAMLEGLRKIYRMGSVADELQGPAAAKPQALTSSQGGSQQ